MRIIWTTHVRDEMAERGISESEARHVITNHETSHPGNHPKKKTTVLTATIEGRRLAVVVEARKNALIAVTTYWRDE